MVDTVCVIVWAFTASRQLSFGLFIYKKLRSSDCQAQLKIPKLLDLRPNVFLRKSQKKLYSFIYLFILKIHLIVSN